MSPREQAELIEAATAEAHAAEGKLLPPILLDSTAALAICSQLEIAQRHPQNAGASSRVGREFVVGVRDKFLEIGMPAHAKMIEAGMDPANDYDARNG